MAPGSLCPVWASSMPRVHGAPLSPGNTQPGARHREAACYLLLGRFKDALVQAVAQF